MVCGSTTDYMAYIKVYTIGMAPLKHNSPEHKGQGMLLLNCGQTKLSAVSLSGHKPKRNGANVTYQKKQSYIWQDYKLKQRTCSLCIYTKGEGNSKLNKNINIYSDKTYQCKTSGRPLVI